jgi:CDP-diacylglycerol--glycerol-3-phosphate 3-phosphatidyltransferase
VARLLARPGVAPSRITTAGLLSSFAVPLVVLPGGFWIAVAGAFVLVSALADTVDGGVAVMSGRTTGMGSFYDSVADRLSEVAWLVAFWLIGAPVGVVAACGGVVFFHEYVRSSAALAGVPRVRAITAAERPSRVVIVFVALVLSGLGSIVSDDRLAAGIVTVAAAGWLVLAVMGAVRLFGAVRTALR